MPNLFSFTHDDFSGAPLCAAVDLRAYVGSPLLWAIALGGIGLWCMMPRSSRRARMTGAGLAGMGLVLFGYFCHARAPLGNQLSSFVFWSLSALTIAAAGVAISSRSAVYTAIWFAVSLLGTAGLFLFQGAQFLGVATIVVYAGAIVVTFLFVVMLAQPEGHDPYDRVSWGALAKPAAVISAALLVGVLALSLASVREAEPPVASASKPVLAEQPHMASLGNELFSKHLLAVEVAGTLLLVALVGAISIVIHGKKAADAGGDSPHE